MALFRFGKIKIKQTETCSCECSGAIEESEKVSSCCCESDCNARKNKVSVKVLGTGCASCHKLYENARCAVKISGIDAEVEYITDIKKIAEYGIMGMPALVINGKCVSVGKVLSEKEIRDLVTYSMKN